MGKMSKQFFVHYEYTCWKCPKRHGATATMRADTADDAQKAFEKEYVEWEGLDSLDYDVKVTGVSWRV